MTDDIERAIGKLTGAIEAQSETLKDLKPLIPTVAILKDQIDNPKTGIINILSKHHENLKTLNGVNAQRKTILGTLIVCGGAVSALFWRLVDIFIIENGPHNTP